jgi:hypothetical protein
MAASLCGERAATFENDFFKPILREVWGRAGKCSARGVRRLTETRGAEKKEDGENGEPVHGSLPELVNYRRRSSESLPVSETGRGGFT